MNEEPVRDLNVVKPKDLRNRSFVGYILVLLLGIVIGSGLSAFLTQLTGRGKNFVYEKIPVTEPRKTDFPQQITDEKLPISLRLLQNPMVYQWRGSVQGKVVAKDEHSLTLENESGYKITLTNILPTGEEWRSIVFKDDKRVSFMDLDYGDRIVGEFWIFPGGNNTSVADVLEVKNE